jgi:multiple sugar transport system substrate-binding protein
MSRPRFLVRLAVVAVALCALTTALWLGATSAQAQGKVELLFRQADPPGEVEGLVAAVNAWNASHPNIQVRFETVPWKDAQAQLVRELQVGGGPDVAQIAFVWTASLGRSGLLKDLAPLVKAAPPGKGLGDFLATDLGTVGDKIYGLPWTVDTATMVYRPDLLAKAGIAKFPETWEELARVAKRLTLDTKGAGRIDQYGFCWPAGSGPDGATWFIVNAYLWSHGKSFIRQAPGGQWEVGITPQELAGVMRYFKTFFDEKMAPESLIAISWEGDPEVSGSLGRGACAISNFRLGTFRAAAKQSPQPIRMTLVPRGPVKRASHLGGRTLAINPHTKYPNESWEFLKYLASSATFKTYDQFPAQKALLAEVQARLPEAEKAYADQLTYGTSFRDYIFSGANVNGMWAATNREFGGVFSGQKSIEQGSADLVRAMGTLLAEGKK